MVWFAPHEPVDTDVVRTLTEGALPVPKKVVETVDIKTRALARDDLDEEAFGLGPTHQRLVPGVVWFQTCIPEEWYISYILFYLIKI